MSVPALLTLSWCALVILTIVVRHAHATVFPFETPYETPLAFDVGVIPGVVVALLLAGLTWWDRRAGAKTVPNIAPIDVRPRVLALIVTGSVLVLAFVMLLRPIPEISGSCPKIVQLNSFMSIEWSCDSSWFQRLAEDPSQLLDQGQPRQGRPLYVLVGSLLTYTVGRAAGWLGLGQWQGEDARSFVSLVLINFVVLGFAAYYFARRMLRLGALPAAVAGLSVFLLYNDVTAEWSWTPHQQTFAMLVPVVTVLAAAQAMVRPVGWREALWWGLGVGLLSLAYGSWIVTAAAMGLVFLVRKHFQALLGFGAGFAALAGGWILFCKIVVGSYYNHEAVVYRQFLWILDAWEMGLDVFLRYVGSYFLLTIREILGTGELWALAALTTVGIVIAALKRVDLRPADAHGRALLGATALTIGVYAVFLFGMGFYTTRLSAGLVPAALFLVGWVFSRLSPAARWTAFIPAGAAAAWLAFSLWP